MGVPSRLVLVGPYPPPWGGISVHLRALRALASRSGVEAEILDVGESHGSRTGADRVYDGGSRVRFLAGLARAVGRGDAVHVHTPGNNLKAWLVALAASRPRRYADRRLLTVHSGLAPALLERSPRARALARAAAPGYRRVLCTNADIAGALEACGIPRDRLQVVSPFLPPDAAEGRTPPAARDARRRHRVLLSCALAPGAQYGEAVLLGALARLVERHPGLGCMVFGPGTDGLSGDGRGGASARGGGGSDSTQTPPIRRGLDGVLVALGELEHDEALGAIGLSDVFVRPTLADGDSLSVREALGLGVRVVASDAAPRPRGVLTFAAGDPAALAGRIEDALRQRSAPARAERGGEASTLEAWRAIGLAAQGATR